MLGIGIILASVAAMAFADALVKLISADLSLWQLFVVRSLFGIPCLLVLGLFRRDPLRPLSINWTACRCALLVLTWITYYASLPVLELSVAAVAIYTNPIMTALLCAVVLKERVSGRQWLGVLLGFAGVLAILRPGSDSFSWFIVLPFLGALFYSLAMVLTRTKCQAENPLTLALALHIAFLLTGCLAILILLVLALDAPVQNAFPFLLDGWVSMGSREWFLLAFLGILSGAYFLGVARAYQIAPPQIIATFDYGYLVSAALWGYVIFAEKPDQLTLLGMLLITLAGILVATRPRNADDTRR